ncbi:DUF6036 family nucleotidyltransferase [Plantibacter sp. YIM 135249]|uniref:DUF6036 family nucleotidyltransferase n=1 Tax=Plantibacter sp. YIM 135249 TaxID=3423918 RepID=UPI003D34A2C0
MSVDDYLLDPERVHALLGELATGLISRGVTGHLVVVGGAAIALRYPDDDAVRVTTDIDAVYVPRDAVNAEVARIAERHGLPINWLNDRASPWLPDRALPIGYETSFTIESATDRELIAMKMAAFRPQDLHDLTILARRVGATAPMDLVDIAIGVYGEDSTALTGSREDYEFQARDVFLRMREQDRHSDE